VDDVAPEIATGVLPAESTHVFHWYANTPSTSASAIVPVLAVKSWPTVGVPVIVAAPVGEAFGVNVTGEDAVEATPVPAAFVAVTVNVYALDVVRPVTVIGDADPLAVILPGLAVTM
jgi:hypothetical protein